MRQARRTGNRPLRQAQAGAGPRGLALGIVSAAPLGCRERACSTPTKPTSASTDGGQERRVGSRAGSRSNRIDACRPLPGHSEGRRSFEEADPSAHARAGPVSLLRRRRGARASSQGTPPPAPSCSRPSCPASSPASFSWPTRSFQVQASARGSLPPSPPCTPSGAARAAVGSPSWPLSARSPACRRGWGIGVLVQRSACARRQPHGCSSLLSDGHTGSRHQSGDGPIGDRADHRSGTVRARQSHRPVALGGAGRGHLRRRPGGPPSPLIGSPPRAGRATSTTRIRVPFRRGASSTEGASLAYHASRIATARVQPAEARSIFTGKQLTVNPVGGSASRLCSFSMWQ